MLEQRHIFTISNGERKTIKTAKPFNCLRFSYYVDLAQTPNTDCFFASNFDLKSQSFTGDVYQLFLLNCCERNYYNQNQTNLMRYNKSIFISQHTLSGYGSPLHHYLCMFEVYFTPQTDFELGCKINEIARYKGVTVECLYTDKNYSLCHTWKLVKNIANGANFEIKFDTEKVFCLCAGAPNDFESKLNDSSILQTENGSFDFPMLYDCLNQETTIFGSYSMELPALWLDSHKNISIINCNFGNLQNSANLYCY